MNTMRVLVVIPPWLVNRAEREAFARSGAAIAPEVPCEILDCTGRASAAALSAHVAPLLDGSRRQLVLLPAGFEGEEAAALLAATVGGRSLGRCMRVQVESGQVIATRAVFGGRAELALRSEAAVTCATLRAEPGAAARFDMPVHAVVLDEPPATQSQPVASAARYPRVEGAPMVVSGGRGIGAPEGFELLARIADSLGAGLGGSLPAVDAGWVPVAHQVGQSGRFVAPKVYFAVAISGTPQHLAGVAAGTRVVALNSDKEAPIFARSDVGVHGDWREILPLVARELERIRGSAE
jgi:electron transfer flavoprotein alpha subunit